MNYLNWRQINDSGLELGIDLSEKLKVLLCLRQGILLTFRTSPGSFGDILYFTTVGFGEKRLPKSRNVTHAKLVIWARPGPTVTNKE